MREYLTGWYVLYTAELGHENCVGPFTSKFNARVWTSTYCHSTEYRIVYHKNVPETVTAAHGLDE